MLEPRVFVLFWNVFFELIRLLMNRVNSCRKCLWELRGGKILFGIITIERAFCLVRFGRIGSTRFHNYLEINDFKLLVAILVGFSQKDRFVKYWKDHTKILIFFDCDLTSLVRSLKDNIWFNQVYFTFFLRSTFSREITYNFDIFSKRQRIILYKIRLPFSLAHNYALIFLPYLSTSRM